MVGKLGGKLSKFKKSSTVVEEPAPKQAAPTKYVKKTNTLGFGFDEPIIKKQATALNANDKYKSLFGKENPFLKKPKFAKTLIATPSKFEIRNEPAVPEKRGRGRPRKNPDDEASLSKSKTESLGVRKTFDKKIPSNGKLSKL